MSAADEARVLAAVPTGLHVDGAWAPATAGRTFDVRDPSSGDVIATVADGDASDGLRALDAAVAAQAAWAATPPRTRSDILRRAFDLLRERADPPSS